MVAHVHAELMKQYAEDAMENEYPHTLWQVSSTRSLAGRWYDLAVNPTWDSHKKYRRKPRTIKIGHYDVPEPLRVAPEVGKGVWIVDVFTSTAVKLTWDSSSNVCNTTLKAGFVHSTKEAAEIHLKALIEVSGGTM